MNVESLSPPLQIPEPLVSYPPTNQEIRKANSEEFIPEPKESPEEVNVEF